MNKDQLIQCIQQEGRFSFSRSGGPGGQNVNKVNTKVLLSIPVVSLNCLSEEERRLIEVKLASRINSEGELYLQIQEERSQLMNKERAVEKLAALVESALYVPKKRKKTRPSKASRMKRLEAKKKRGNTKQDRRAVRFHD